MTTLGGLFAQRPADYFDEYQELVAELRAADPEALGREGAEELGKSPALGEELARLRVALLPGAVLATLRRAVVLLDDDRRELAAAVEDVGRERIEEEERAAGAAQEAYDALRRRWWRRLLGLRGGRVQDALEQVKDHLRAALERRVEFLCLRVFVVILDELLTDLRGGSLPARATTLEQTEALIAALREAQAGIEALHARIGCAPGTYRGPATTKPLPPAQDPMAEAGPEAHLDRVRPILPTLYGASADAVRREMAERLLAPLGDMLRMPTAQVTAGSLSEADLRDAAIKASPLSPIDGTRGSGLRARFVLAPGGDASPLKPLANLAWASAGQADRERWVDAGPELADELTIVTFEEGVPLDAFKGLREASGADGTAGDREDSHLEPLFTLLPDPVTYTTANGDEQRRLILLGLAASALRRVGGGFRYVGGDGAEHAFDPASYAMAAAIASRFVARVRAAGFAQVIRELPRLPGNAWSAAARRLVEDLERLAERYREPLTAERGATR